MNSKAKRLLELGLDTDYFKKIYGKNILSLMRCLFDVRRNYVRHIKDTFDLDINDQKCTFCNNPSVYPGSICETCMQKIENGEEI